MISKKTKWVRTDAWRGYVQPIDAIAGANDTGTWEDSPCPTNVCLSELGAVKSALRKAGIRFKSSINESSNVFCAHRYVLVAKEDREKAKELIEPLIPGTRLLYLCD